MAGAYRCRICLYLDQARRAGAARRRQATLREAAPPAYGGGAVNHLEGRCPPPRRASSRSKCRGVGHASGRSRGPRGLQMPASGRLHGRHGNDSSTGPPCRGIGQVIASRGLAARGSPMSAGRSRFRGRWRREGGERAKSRGSRAPGWRGRSPAGRWVAGPVHPVPIDPRQAEQTVTGVTRPSRFAVAYGEPGNPGAGPLPYTVGSTVTGWTGGR
jgi:hypothetical protein